MCASEGAFLKLRFQSCASEVALLKLRFWSCASKIALSKLCFGNCASAFKLALSKFRSMYRRQHQLRRTLLYQAKRQWSSVTFRDDSSHVVMKTFAIVLYNNSLPFFAFFSVIYIGDDFVLRSQVALFCPAARLLSFLIFCMVLF